MQNTEPYRVLFFIDSRFFLGNDRNFGQRLKNKRLRKGESGRRTLDCPKTSSEVQKSEIEPAFAVPIGASDDRTFSLPSHLLLSLIRQSGIGFLEQCRRLAVGMTGSIEPCAHSLSDTNLLSSLDYWVFDPYLQISEACPRHRKQGPETPLFIGLRFDTCNVPAYEQLMNSKPIEPTQPTSASHALDQGLPFFPEERPLTVPRAADYLGVSKQTVSLWVERKQILHLRVMGQNIRFLRADLEPFRPTFREEVRDGKT
jgi:excisionase family DNA binding protein